MTRCAIGSCDLTAAPYSECCYEHSSKRALATSVTYLDRGKRHLQAELDDLKAYIEEEEKKTMNDRGPDPKDFDPWNDKCDPGCRGWDIFNESLEIQRCDQCKRFIDDHHAAMFVRRWQKAEPLLWKIRAELRNHFPSDMSIMKELDEFLLGGEPY